MTDKRPPETYFQDAKIARVLRTPPGLTATRKILVLATPRSGSTLFCEQLASTGLFGEPAEYLSPLGIASFNRHSDTKITDIRQWWRHLERTAVSVNGVFTVKVMVRQYRYWLSKGFDLLSAGFDRVLYVRRNDFVAQAVSLAKARLTDNWTSTHQVTAGNTPAPLARHHVLAAMAELAAWDDFYRARLAPVVHSTWTYEEFASDPATFRRVLAECGIVVSEDQQFFSDLKVQRTDEDAAWTQQFRQWLGKRLTKQAQGLEV